MEIAHRMMRAVCMELLAQAMFTCNASGKLKSNMNWKQLHKQAQATSLSFASHSAVPLQETTFACSEIGLFLKISINFLFM